MSRTQYKPLPETTAKKSEVFAAWHKTLLVRASSSTGSTNKELCAFLVPYIREPQKLVLPSNVTVIRAQACCPFGALRLVAFPLVESTDQDSRCVVALTKLTERLPFHQVEPK
jgi:hypothetical protein